MYKAVIFDLDNTLLDRDASVKSFIRKQYDRLRTWLSHIPKEVYIDRFIDLDARGYVWKDKVYQQLIEEFNINLSWETLLQDYIDEFHHHCVAFPNLIPTLDELKKSSYKLGMITNGKGQFQLDNIRALGIEDYFDCILISEWEGIKKPNPLIFRRALEEMQVSPKEAIFVGDHPVNDVEGARNVGMIGAWKKDSQWKDVNADYIVEDLIDLLDILKEGIATK
ncbi:HAD family hydrolase [Ornithinibacillus scapharcae]|uniref:HAD family hydrolase n=1 Tax=Ornithinibacillus scapharcae TaxID=1147159 RepID=UPI000225AE02|nr:HAD family hydrolase [Ornithinibacillus scapharcae]